MFFSCPACNKNLEEEIQCPRCGCEVEILQKAHHSAGSLYNSALGSIPTDSPDALQCAEKSWTILHDPKTARIAFIASLLSRDNIASRKWFDLSL